MSNFTKLKDYLSDLGLAISREIPDEELVIVDDEERGIKNLMLDCEESLLIIEQYLFDCHIEKPSTFKRLLQMNRNLVHGAFVLDESGQRVLFRDTLQLANLDLNELEASIDALSLALAEYAEELIEFANQTSKE